MKKASIASLLALFLSFPAASFAQVPATVGFSARIADGGRPVSGVRSFTFRLFNDPVLSEPANLVWTEGPRDITVVDGVVATALGDVPNGGTALPAFTGAPLYLEVTMGATTFSQRMALHSVPYAQAAHAVCTRISETVSIPASSTNGAQVYCPSTHPVIISGGWYTGSSNVVPYDNGPYYYLGNYWYVGARNTNAFAVSLTVYALCCL